MFDFFFYENNNIALFMITTLVSDFLFYKKQKQHCDINDYVTLVFYFIKTKNQGSITAFILKERKNDQNHLLNN